MKTIAGRTGEQEACARQQQGSEALVPAPGTASKRGVPGRCFTFLWLSIWPSQSIKKDQKGRKTQPAGRKKD